MRQAAYLTWPAALAVVIGGRVVEEMSSQQADAHPLYRPEIAFRYDDGSAGHNAVGTASYWTSDRAEADLALSRYPLGAHLTVHVNPQHPEVVEYDANLRSFVLPVLCLAGAVGAWLAASLLKKRS